MSLDQDGLTIEADPGLIEEAIASMGMSNAKPVTSRATRVEFFRDVDAKQIRDRRVRGETEIVETET